MKGTFTALITPFQKGRVDEEGLLLLIERQIAAGITGLVLLGTTGEHPTLTPEERKRVISLAVLHAKGRLLLLVGAGCNCTENTLKEIQHAADLGADGVSVIAPYYNRPGEEGLFHHFATLATHSPLPLILYNNPVRTGVHLTLPLLQRLKQFPSIVGLKECSGNFGEMAHSVHLLPLFSGDDIVTLPLLALGAHGVISVVSNLVPKQMVALVQAGLEGRFEEARTLHQKLLPLFELSMIESNPVPIKAALALCNLPSGGCRLPLYGLKEAHERRLKEVIEKMEVQ